MEFTAQNAYLAALNIDLVNRIRGYFQPSSFVVSGDPYEPTEPTPTPTTPTDTQSAETDATTLKGQPLYLKANGHVDLAQASATATTKVTGLAIEDATAATAVNYSPDGIVERADWTAITGTATLTPGATYFLSPDLPGRLTAIAPESPGQFVAVVGTALSAQKLAIEIQSPILL